MSRAGHTAAMTWAHLGLRLPAGTPAPGARREKQAGCQSRQPGLTLLLASSADTAPTQPHSWVCREVPARMGGRGEPVLRGRALTGVNLFRLQDILF